MDSQLKIQFVIVGIIILAAIVWVAVSLWRSLSKKHKADSSPCFGCTLSDSCTKLTKSRKDNN